jgi:hypothetical protein
VEAVLRGSVAPPQKRAATRAALGLPGIAGKPGELGRGLAAPPATGRPGKAPDVERIAIGVGEAVLVAAADFDSRGRGRDARPACGTGKDAAAALADPRTLVSTRDHGGLLTLSLRGIHGNRHSGILRGPEALRRRVRVTVDG